MAHGPVFELFKAVDSGFVKLGGEDIEEALEGAGVDVKAKSGSVL